MSAPADRFVAQTYLDDHPDVAKAVEEGRMQSAWSHYVQWGFGEKRSGVPEAVRKKVQAVMDVSIPQPSAKLISRVHGTSDSAGFARTGRIVALDLFSAVDAHLQLDRPMRILDFGCGCARVLRYMCEIAPQSTFDAMDIDEEAIQWCRDNYRDDVQHGRFHFIRNPNLPPTSTQSDSFDFVYAISVFTHLPEDMQLQWLGELRRLTKPGGVLAISTANDALIRKHLSSENSRTLDEKGFYYFPYGGTDGLPEFYQAAWHTPSYIEQVWSKYFRIVEQIPAGIAGHQDLVLCVKR
jgi:SAM-dependent methyltransferase